MDEMRSYCGNKKNQVWLWLAIDHDTHTPLAFTFGTRKHRFLDELINLLKPFNRLPAKSRKSIPLSFSTSYFLPYPIFDFAGSLVSIFNSAFSSNHILAFGILKLSSFLNQCSTKVRG